QGQMCLKVGQTVLDAFIQGHNSLTLFQTGLDRIQALSGAKSLTLFLSQYADEQVLRGLLALEWGDIRLARQCFQTSLAMWIDEEAVRTGAGIEFNGRRLAQHYLHLIESAGP